MLSERIQVPIYKTVVNVFIGFTDQLVTYLMDHTELDVNSNEFDSCAGCVIVDVGNSDEDMILYINDRYKDELPTIIHELAHLAMCIMARANAYFGKEIHHQEALCYLLEYLSGEILPIIRNYLNKEEDETITDEES